MLLFLTNLPTDFDRRPSAASDRFALCPTNANIFFFGGGGHCPPPSGAATVADFLKGKMRILLKKTLYYLFMIMVILIIIIHLINFHSFNKMPGLYNESFLTISTKDRAKSEIRN